MGTLDIVSDLLKTQNKSQKDLTDFLGIKKNAFTNWKNGHTKSYKKYLPQIADFLSVSIDYLLGKESNSGTGNVDYTYAAYDELTKELNPEQIKQLVDFANFLRQQNK